MTISYSLLSTALPTSFSEVLESWVDNGVLCLRKVFMFVGETANVFSALYLERAGTLCTLCALSSCGLPYVQCGHSRLLVY